MAHLLGHRGCMESLRADLRDLQAAIADVSSRAGAVRFPSWKFPDKVSCELDLAVLLERYGYTEGDPAFSQHSHVVLLELLIDRLLLLLQTFTGYAENLLSEQATPLPQAVGPCMSAGRTARRYWHSMLKLGAFHQQLLDERLQLGASSEVGRSTSQCPPSSVPAPGSSGSGSPVPRAARSTAESSRSISTQTTHSFLEPCATCASAQASLREVGQTISSICQSQNIPSALSRFQELVDNSTGRRTLSARDVSGWASEQSKDLSRISKHLQMLLQQVSPLKAQLEDSEKQRDELQKQVEDISKSLQAEKRRRAQQRKEAKQSAKAKREEHLVAVARLERDKDELRRGAAVLEERLSALQEELAVKRAAVQELGKDAWSPWPGPVEGVGPPEDTSSGWELLPVLPSLGQRCRVSPEGTKSTLREELRSATVARSRVMELEEKVQLLSGERERLGQELSATSTQLGKEKAKVESILRHEESLQAKQRVLMQHVDWLDQQREVLEASLGEAKEDKARLAEQLEESQEQSRQQLRTQQELLDVLRREKLNLEQSVSELQAKVSRLEEQTRGMQERERPLMFFPELHVPAEAQIESTGSLTKDMEKQIQANSIPVGVLEQNTRLRSALPKLKAAAERGVLKFIPQSQLLSQLSSQRSRQDAGRPSSQGGRDSTGPQGDADKAQQKLPVATVLPAASRLPSSRGLPMASGLPEAGAYGHSRQSPPASPGPCLSLLATGLVPRLCETGTERTCPPCSHHTYGHHK
ncbi:coiled-coil domain-containing protein 157 isoform X1 [Falco naumanni]|uniref:coiled-coil domain-containing protein 157 isoform X1 n=1 Tax=Falco naumanni TaxID=148594 RepID=UPI001ADE9A2E|nr:coiled-coil domain-containing protein 157 isoform X1 [Falco naumanni]